MYLLKQAKCLSKRLESVRRYRPERRTEDKSYHADGVRSACVYINQAINFAVLSRHLFFLSFSTYPTKTMG